MLNDNYYSSNKKILSSMIDITQLLNQHKFTYNEIEHLISLLQDWIKQSREEYEYNTIDDFINGNRTNIADNVIVGGLNHVKDYC